MGESYKSLTIRIGADDSDLKSALSSIQQAARQTQSQLRLMSRALMLDPSRIENVEKKLRLMRASAETTATELNRVRRPLMDYRGTEIEKMANDWKNVAQRAYEVKERYDANYAKLKEIKEQLIEVAKQHNLTFDPKDLEQYLGVISKIDSKSKTLVQAYKNLSKEQDKLNSEWEQAKEVMRFDNAVNQAHVLEAELKSVYTRVAQIESKAGVNKLAPSLETAKNHAQSFSNELHRVNDTLRLVDEALRLDPKNIELLTQKANLFYQKTKLTEQQLNELKETLKTMQSAGFEAAAEDMIKLEREAQEAKDSFVAINTNLDKMRGRLSTLTAEADKFKVAIKAKQNIEENKAALAKVNEKIQETNSYIKSVASSAEKARQVMVKADGRLEYAKLDGEIKKVSASLNTMRGAAEKANIGLLNSIRDISTTLAATVTPLALTGLYRIVASAEKIDSAYRDMRKTVEGTEEQFESLRQSAIEMSKTSIVSADQLLEIEAMGGQLGIAVENLETFAVTCANLDIATDLSSEEISTQLGQLNNLLEFGTGDMERYGDALVRLGNNMPTTESRISGVTTAIGAAAHQFGMSTPEILAWSAAIASTGQGTEAAGTAISNTMYDIEAAVNGTTDKASEQLEGFAKTAGMTSEEFANAWNNNASYAMQEFVKGLKQLELDGDSASNRLSELGINAVRQRRALLGLSQTVGNLDNALEMSNHAWKGISDQWGKAGDAANEADKKMQGFSGLVGKLKNNAAALGDTIGNSLVPMLQFAVEAFQTFNEFVSAIPQPILSTLTALVSLVAVLAPIGRIVGQAAVTWVQFTEALYKSRVATLLQTAANKGMTSAEVEQIMATKKANQERRNKILGVKEETAAVEKETVAEKENATATKVGAQADEVATASAKKMTAATKAKYLALNAAKVAAGLLALEGIMILIEKAGELAEQPRNVTLATKGMETSFKSAVISASTNADAIRMLGDAAGYTLPKFSELAERQGQIASAIRDVNTKMIENVSMMEAYGEAVGKLTDRSDLSAEEIANLKIAVDGLAQSTGEALTVEQDESGVWRVMKDDAIVLNDELQSLIQSKKILAQLDAAKENAVSAYKAEQEAAMALGKAQSQLAEAEAQANKEREEQGIVSEETAARVAVLKEQVQQYSATADSAAKASKFFADQQTLLQMVADGNASSMQRYIAEHFELQGAIQGAGVDMLDFIKYLEESGVAIENLTAESFPELVEQYKISIGEIKEEAKDGKDHLITTTEEAFAGAVAAVKAKSPELISAAAKTCSLTEDEFEKLAFECGVDSEEAMVNFCKGIQGGREPARIQALALATATEDPITSMNSYQWGTHLGQNFAEGLASNEDYVRRVSNLLAEAAASGLQFSVPKEGVWSGAEKGGVTSGQHLVENFIAGMKSKEDALRTEAEHLGLVLYSAINGYDYASVSSRAYAASAAAVGSVEQMRQATAAAQAYKVATNNVTHDTQYILSGDINITTKSDNPKEIVDEIVRVFTVAQNAYA